MTTVQLFIYLNVNQINKKYLSLNKESLSNQSRKKILFYFDKLNFWFGITRELLKNPSKRFFFSVIFPILLLVLVCSLVYLYFAYDFWVV